MSVVALPDLNVLPAEAQFAPTVEPPFLHLEFPRASHLRRVHWCFACSFPQRPEILRDLRIEFSLPELEIEPFNHLLVSPDSCLRCELVLSLHALQTGRGRGIGLPRLSTQGLRSRPPD